MNIFQAQAEANAMALEQVDQTLQEARLEQRVAERMAELSRMNRQLQQEIQRQQQTEAELRHSQRDLKDFVENAIVALHRLDVNGTILWANQAELDMLGYSREEFIGHSILEFHVNPEVVADIMSCLLDHQPVRAHEVQFRCKDGSICHVLLDSSGCWKDGKFSHTRCFMRDITENKRLEAEKQKLESQFLRAQRLESLGTLASGIAHDMNNVLTPILAVSQLLPLKLSQLDENSHKLLRMLEESAKRGGNLVQQILSFARGSDGTRTSIRLEHILNEVVRIAHQTFPK